MSAGPRARGTHNTRGILLMVFAMFGFAFVDAQTKILSQDLPVLQVTWARQFGMLVPVAVILWPRHGRRVFRTRHLGLQVLRGAMAVGSAFLFIAAVKFVPLADAVALTFVFPLIVTALSGVVLREHAGPRRWLAVFIGFAATMIIIRPGTGVLHPAAFLALGAAALFAARQLIARVISDTDDTATTFTYSAITGAVILTAAVPFVWVTPPTWPQAAMLAGLGLWAAAAEFAVIKAFESAPGAVVAPFHYTMIIWATAYGFLWFGDLPDQWTLIGTLILIASGLYALYRERPGEFRPNPPKQPSTPPPPPSSN